MTPAGLEIIAQSFAGSFMNTFAWGAILAALTWIVLRLLGRQSSGTRFTVWFSALLTLAALPLLAGLAARDFSHVSASGASSAPASWVVPASWAIYFILMWMSLAAVLLGRVAAGLWQIKKLREDSRVVDIATLDPLLQAVWSSAGLRRKITLCLSDRVRTPAALGFFKPSIILPSWALCELSTAELNVILLHELAHLRRFDDWTNLAQQIIKALFFFHPAVWWMDSRLTLEREMACDEWVLAETENPKAYAASLIALAEKVRLGRSLTLVQAAIGRMRQTSLRIAQILDGNHPVATQGWKPVAGLGAVLSVVVLLGQAHAPKLIAFQQSTQSLPASAFAMRSPVPPTVFKTVSEISLKGSPATTRVSTRGISRSAAVSAQAVYAAPSKTTEQARAIQASGKVPVQGEKTPAGYVSASVVRELPAARQYFVVMQTAQLDDNGTPVFSLCIWRVTETHSGQQRIEEIVMKSI